jgi:hypothetical protein
VETSIQNARALIEAAFAELAGFGEGAARLRAVARYLVERKN